MEVNNKALHSMFKLDNKVIVITGACGLLGSQYCRALVEAGADVVIGDLYEEECKALALSINSNYTNKAHPMPVNLASEASIISWADAVLEKFGHVDVLINNAAIKTENFFKRLEEFPLEDWNKVMSVNVSAIFLTAREFGAHMATRGSGSIINVSSIYGIVGPDQRIYEGSWHEHLNSKINTPLIYSATKGAIISMTRYLAAYWGGTGVRTNSISPGGIEDAQNTIFNSLYSKRVPMGRMAKPEEMLGAILYLASDASSYVNGHNLVVDGGWTAW